MASTIANNVPNTIVVSEKRNVVDGFRNWYKEKIIDTGVSQKFEEGLVGIHRVQEKMVNVVGSVATVIFAVYPEEGPLGEAITIIATPLVKKGLEFKNKIQEKGIITAKRKFEVNFIKADGSSEKVFLPDLKLEEIVKESKDLMTMIPELEIETSKGVKR